MARKSKGFGELLHQQQRAKGQQESIEKLTKRVQKSFEGSIENLRINPQGEGKMSEVLEAFVEPYMEAAQSRDERLKLLSVAVAAWNLALAPEEQQQQDLENLVNEICGEDRQAKQEMREILEELMERKRSSFADIRRYIFDFELQESRNDIHLTVVSAPMPEDKQ